MFFLLKRIRAIPSHKHVNKHTCTWSSLQASLLFERPTKERWKRPRARQNVQSSKDSSVTLESEYLLDWLNFFTIAHFDFTFNKKRLVNGYYFVSQLNDPFLTPVKWLSKVKSLVLHLLSVPQTGGHIINISFFSINLYPARFTFGP